MVKTVASIGPVLLLGGCASNSTFLLPHGPVAHSQRTHFFEIILILLIVVIPVLLGTPIIAWHYRISNRSATYRPRWSFWWPLEVLIWGIPVCIVIVLSIWLVRGTYRLDPYRALAMKAPPLRIQVVGYDWKWLFIYPSLHIATAGQMAFPVNTPIRLDLTSASVMQALFIPSLGSQIYAMGGMVTHLNLAATDEGNYKGENSQYNGDEFQDQKFNASAMSVQDFDKWVKDVRSEGIKLTRKNYIYLKERNKLADLRQKFKADKQPAGVVFFRDVPDHLFDRIVAATTEPPGKSISPLADNQSRSAAGAKMGSQPTTKSGQD